MQLQLSDALELGRHESGILFLIFIIPISNIQYYFFQYFYQSQLIWGHLYQLKAVSFETVDTSWNLNSKQVSPLPEETNYDIILNWEEQRNTCFIKLIKLLTCKI